jgi:hypothetical protein
MLELVRKRLIKYLLKKYQVVSRISESLKSKSIEPVKALELVSLACLGLESGLSSGLLSSEASKASSSSTHKHREYLTGIDTSHLLTIHPKSETLPITSHISKSTLLEPSHISLLEPIKAITHLLVSMHGP